MSAGKHSISNARWFLEHHSGPIGDSTLASAVRTIGELVELNEELQGVIEDLLREQRKADYVALMAERREKWALEQTNFDSLRRFVEAHPVLVQLAGERPKA